MKKQFEYKEDEINKLKHCKYGRATNVFKMREQVCGRKKAPQEAHAVKNVKTGEHAVSNDEIKEVTLTHCINTFKKNDPEEDVETIVELRDKLHLKRMKKDYKYEPMIITKDEFDETVNKFEKKNKHSHDFLTKARKLFQDFGLQVV